MNCALFTSPVQYRRLYVSTTCGHLEEGHCFSVRMKENSTLTTVHAELTYNNQY